MTNYFCRVFSFGSSTKRDYARTSSKSVIGHLKEIDPRDYGAKLDGATDDSPALTLAIAAAALVNGKVVIDGTMALGYSGWTGIVLTGLTRVAIEGTSPGAGIKCLFRPSQSMGATAKVFLKLSSCTQVSIRNLYVDLDSINTVGIGLVNSTGCVIERNMLINSACTLGGGISSLGGTYNRFLSNYATTTTDGVQGMWIGNSSSGEVEQYALIDGNVLYRNGNGGSIGGTGIAGVLQDSVISNNVCVGNGGSGVALGVSTLTAYKNVTISGNYCAGNKFHGIQSDSSDGAKSLGISVVGNVCTGQNGSGIYCVNAKDWAISGNVLKNNGQTVGEGITIQSAERITVTGNQIYDDQGSPTQRYGINSSGANSALDLVDIVIRGNQITGNKLANVFATMSSGTGKNLVIDGNICRTTTDSSGQGIRVSAGWTNVIVRGNIALNNPTMDIRVDVDAVVGDNIYTQGYFPGNAISRLGAGAKSISYGTAAPVAGTWVAGDQVLNSAPASGGFLGFVCTVGGTPGTWKTFGVIS